MKPIDSRALYLDGLHYDAQHVEIVEDIPFYIAKAKKYSEPILELACGTGRITIPIARQGFDATGRPDRYEPRKHTKAHEKNITY